MEKGGMETEMNKHKKDISIDSIIVKLYEL